jgi:hypothetical protein
MKVLLQHVESGLFLTPSGQTTPNADEAEDFVLADSAFAATRIRRIRGFQVVVYFSDGKHSVPIMLCDQPS